MSGQTNSRHARSAAPRRPRAGVLWGGGAATAVVAALVALVGSSISENIANIDLLPSGSGIFGWSDHLSYPAAAAMLAIGATGVLHLLLLGVPQPMRFFGWLMALVVVIVAVAPFGYSGVAMETLVATAIVNVVSVIPIWALLPGVARRAMVGGGV